MIRREHLLESLAFPPLVSSPSWFIYVPCVFSAGFIVTVTNIYLLGSSSSSHDVKGSLKAGQKAKSTTKRSPISMWEAISRKSFLSGIGTDSN